MKISIIIPLKNEAKYIGRTILGLETNTIDKSNVEIILVDCGCLDNSIDVAKTSSGVIPIIYSKADVGQSRGVAYNAGFELISGSMVLFMKSDALLPYGFDMVLRNSLMVRNDTLLASFTLKLSCDANSVTSSTNTGASPTVYNRNRAQMTRRSQQSNILDKQYEMEYATVLKTIQFYMNARSKWCSLPSLSQCYCMRSDIFRQLKFKPYLVLDDLAFVTELRLHMLKMNKTRTYAQQLKFIQYDQCVGSSSIVHKYHAVGVGKYMVLETLALILYLYDVSVVTIYTWCYKALPKYGQWVKL